MQPPIQLKAVDWYTAEWDYVPPAGETYVICRFDTQEKFLKIGDGQHRLGELPNISTSILGEEIPKVTIAENTCAQCEHLCTINRNKVYAVCDEIGKTFFMWQEDTRTANSCKHFSSRRSIDFF